MYCRGGGRTISWDSEQLVVLSIGADFAFDDVLRNLFANVCLRGDLAAGGAYIVTQIRNENPRVRAMSVPHIGVFL